MSILQQSIVAQWNEVALEAIREGSAKPTATTYQLHLNSAAVYDAWAAFDDDAYGYYSEISTGLANSEANKAEAVSFAAFTSLTALFPDEVGRFEDFLVHLGYDPEDAVAGTATAAGLGTLATENVFAARVGDGSNFENGFEDTSGYTPVNSADPDTGKVPGGENFDPNHWQPLRVPTGTVVDENGVPIIDNNDPGSYVDQIALTPQWGGVKSFALASNDQFRPDAPPQLGDFSPYVDGNGTVTTNDQAYRDQIAEVLDVSANLTTEQKAVAELWADGPRTESPPGHWNQIAQDIALRDGHGNDEDAKLFFALNAAVFDAGIATWEAKYVYDYVRPQSAIRDLFYDETVAAWGGVNQGTQLILGQEWQPYQNVTFVTPPFPEYVSGHSTFSMAAANTIASFVGSDQYFDGISLSNYDLDGVAGIDLLGRYETSELSFEDFGAGPPVVLQWDTLTEAALEAGASRIYGGIHIQDGNLKGLDVGSEVAANAEIRWQALFTRGGDDDIMASPDGGLIIAGAGDDRVTGGPEADIVEAGSGDDLVMGRDGDDNIQGENGDDTLYGGLDEDEIEGGDGDDLINGGRGDDILRGDKGDDTIWGARDDDEISGGAGDDIIYGHRGNDFIMGDEGDDLLHGNRDEDEIHGGTGDDHINGGRGDDMLYGDAGDDMILGARGDDEISGGLGNDVLHGNRGNDAITGDEGNDNIFGFLDDDTLEGGTGDDSIFGGSGNDVLVGEDGDDTVTGGLGEDTFVFYFSDIGTDIVTDFDGTEDILVFVGFTDQPVSFVQQTSDVLAFSGSKEIAILNNLDFNDLELAVNVFEVDSFLI